MENDVSTVITMENFAAFELPLPSSFDTLTLQNRKQNKGTHQHSTTW